MQLSLNQLVFVTADKYLVSLVSKSACHLPKYFVLFTPGDLFCECGEF